MPHQITLIPGDGIGPEVADACVKVLDATGVRIDWDEQPAGISALDAGYDDALPEVTVDSVRKNSIALKGPTATPVGTGHRSANVRLRKELDLYASIRPVRSVEGVNTRYENVDLVVFRENTEGLYAGLENRLSKGVVVSIKVVTEEASRRIARQAFEYAVKHGRKRVTAVHKANILKVGDGLFLRCAREVAEDYPSIEFNDGIIDATCMRLVQRPTDSTSCSWKTSTATSSPTFARVWWVDSASCPGPTSVRTRRSSKPCTAPPPTSRARVSRTPPRFSRARC
jgi:isocitrate dehydrogenase (NAD+)